MTKQNNDFLKKNPVTSNISNMKCDLCGSDRHSIKYEVHVREENMKFYRFVRNISNPERFIGTFNIVKCEECELVSSKPQPSQKDLEIVYSSNKIIGGRWKNFSYLFKTDLPDEMQTETESIASDSNENDWKFDIINKYRESQQKNLKLLDLGCGNGKFVYDALKREYDAYGLDLSEGRIEEGKELYNLGNRIQCKNVHELDEGEKFDVIVMFDVIEHVSSPSSLLQYIKRISHAETKIFALTMSLDSITHKLFKKEWYYIHPFQHLHYFSHETIRKMYEKNGFELVAAELDNSRDKNLIHLFYRIIIGQLNRFFFRIYSRQKKVRLLFKPFLRNVSDERMKKRIENLYPGKYLGRYHDNFVFIGKLKS